jgi:hypothetical protein
VVTVLNDFFYLIGFQAAGTDFNSLDLAFYIYFGLMDIGFKYPFGFFM